MRMLASPGSEVHFTHLSQASCNALFKSFGESSASARNPDIADVFCTTEGVLDLIRTIGVSQNQVCLLDPKAERELSPDDRYTHFLFGVGANRVLPRIELTSAKGILGKSQNALSMIISESMYFRGRSTP